MEHFISSLLGALVGGLLAFIGVYISHRLQLSRQKKQDQQVIRGLLQAILTELDTCWSRAKTTVNSIIEHLPDKQAFESEVFIKTDFFTVYHNNSHLLGRINDDNLRNGIVSTYTRYKALVETFNVNTQYVQAWKKSIHMESVTSESELKVYYHRKAENDYMQLLGWAAALKNDHEQLKQQIEELIPALQKAIATTVSP